MDRTVHLFFYVQGGMTSLVCTCIVRHIRGIDLLHGLCRRHHASRQLKFWFRYFWKIVKAEF